jgi:hypothetical protein
MKTILKISVVAFALFLMLIADVPLLPVQLVPEADAFFGVRRRTRRRTAVVVGSAASAQTAATQQQTAAAQQQAATAQQQQAAAAAPPAPQPAAAGKPFPLGTVVSALPSGSVATPVGGVEYYYVGGNFYRAVFQGNTLVYVTAQPK